MPRVMMTYINGNGMRHATALRVSNKATENYKACIRARFKYVVYMEPERMTLYIVDGTKNIDLVTSVMPRVTNNHIIEACEANRNIISAWMERWTWTRVDAIRSKAFRALERGDFDMFDDAIREGDEI